jgi:hypothetical protein
MESSPNRFNSFIYKNLIAIFLLAGLALIYASTSFSEACFWHGILEKLGLSVFSSGVFAAVLKSIQFTGLFKEEIEKVMLGSEFIKKRNDLVDLWKKVSNAVYKSKFPELSHELDEIILNTYFPTDKEYYYRDYRVTINIDELTGDDVIKFTQTCKFYVVLSGEIPETKIETSITIDKVDGEKTFKNEIEYYRVDGKDIEPTIVPHDKDDSEIFDYSVTIKGKKEFYFEKKDKRQYSIKNDNTKLFRVGSITKEMDVSIVYPDNMEVTFFNIGLVNDFEKKHVEHKRSISRTHKKGIILPHQGFGLSFRRK